MARRLRTTSAARLAVEVDGEFHDRPKLAARDGARDAYLQSQGITVLRFRTVDVLESMDAVLDGIHGACRARIAEPPP